MAGKVIINPERCKGCGVCVDVCPNQVLAISKNANKMGYFFSEPCREGCTGCAICALVCPDVAIEVYRLTTEEVAQP